MNSCLSTCLMQLVSINEPFITTVYLASLQPLCGQNLFLQLSLLKYCLYCFCNSVTAQKMFSGRSISPETVKLHRLVSDKLRLCLETTNMSDYFTQEGLFSSALANAKFVTDTIHKFIPVEFSNLFHNSCWRSDLSLTVINSTVCGHFGQFAFETKIDLSKLKALQKTVNFSSNFSCLPDVFLAGFPKCGSTFLNALITSHPAVVKPLMKEPLWWQTTSSYNLNFVAAHLSNYLVNFAPLVDLLSRNQEDTIHSMDATPSLMFDCPKSLNKDCRINFCLLPAVLPSVLPKSKFIVVMRNPVSMLYSAFWFSCTRPRHGSLPSNVALRGPKIFHERIAAKIHDFNSCIESFPLAKCVVDAHPNLFTPELPTCGRTRLDIGIYFLHVQKWLSVVPRDRFLFLTLEELSDQTEKVANRIWRFLNVSPMSGSVQKAMANYTRAMNQQQTIDYRRYQEFAMRNDTKELLVNFFKPYNQKLANLVGDNKFLWQ